MEETLRIVRRNEEEITISVHKIVEAITAAARQVINECIERVHELFLSMLHSTWHWLMHWFHRKINRLSTARIIFDSGPLFMRQTCHLSISSVLQKNPKHLSTEDSGSK